MAVITAPLGMPGPLTPMPTASALGAPIAGTTESWLALVADSVTFRLAASALVIAPVLLKTSAALFAAEALIVAPAGSTVKSRLVVAPVPVYSSAPPRSPGCGRAGRRPDAAGRSPRSQERGIERAIIDRSRAGVGVGPGERPRARAAVEIERHVRRAAVGDDAADRARAIAAQVQNTPGRRRREIACKCQRSGVHGVDRSSAAGGIADVSGDHVVA